MHKRLFLLLLAVLLICPPVFASVGIQKDGEMEGAATNINFSSDEYSNDGSTFNVPVNLDLIVAGINKGDVTVVVTGPTALPSSYKLAIVYITTKTLTLADGLPGQVMTIIGMPLTDKGTVTLTATTKYGWTSAAIADVKDSITLHYIDDTYGWVIVGNNNLTITQ